METDFPSIDKDKIVDLQDEQKLDECIVSETESEMPILEELSEPKLEKSIIRETSTV